MLTTSRLGFFQIYHNKRDFNVTFFVRKQSFGKYAYFNYFEKDLQGVSKIHISHDIKWKFEFFIGIHIIFDIIHKNIWGLRLNTHCVYLYFPPLFHISLDTMFVRLIAELTELATTKQIVSMRWCLFSHVSIVFHWILGTLFKSDSWWDKDVSEIKCHF